MADADTGRIVTGEDHVSWSRKTVQISYDEAPKSNNAGGGGRGKHWGAAHKEKMMWEGIYGMLLMAAQLPRGACHVSVDVLLEFKTRTRRDEENYRQSVTKPLADALVKGGWLADDTREFFEVGTFTVASGSNIIDARAPQVQFALKSRITIAVTATYEESDDGSD